MSYTSCFRSFSFSSLWGGVPPSFLYPSHQSCNKNEEKPLHMTLVDSLTPRGCSAPTNKLENAISDTSSFSRSNNQCRTSTVIKPFPDERMSPALPKDIIVISDSSDESEDESSVSPWAVVCCGIKLFQSDFHSLLPGNWLNDKVINAYMKLILLAYQGKDIYIASTFFYTKLQRSGFQGVSKWLKNVNVSELSKMLIPVHTGGNHWSLAHIDMRKWKIEYYDSLGLRNRDCMKKLKLLVMKFFKHFKMKPASSSKFQAVYPKDIPRQTNGSDCGVFVCQYARWLSSLDGQTIEWSYDCPFSSKEAIRLRYHMIQEMKQGQLSLQSST